MGLKTKLRSKAAVAKQLWADRAVGLAEFVNTQLETGLVKNILERAEETLKALKKAKETPAPKPRSKPKRKKKTTSK